MPAEPPRTVYVVRRRSWVRAEDGFLRPPSSTSGPPGVPVRVFADRRAAEAFCREQEEKACRTLAPGRVVELEVRDPWHLDAVLTWLGLNPPDVTDHYSSPRDLLAWWIRAAPAATEEQRAAIWEALGVRFYDVAETTLEG
jgi:hypothetical protein